MKFVLYWRRQWVGEDFFGDPPYGCRWVLETHDGEIIWQSRAIGSCHAIAPYFDLSTAASRAAHKAAFGGGRLTKIHRIKEVELPAGSQPVLEANWPTYVKENGEKVLIQMPAL